MGSESALNPGHLSGSRGFRPWGRVPPQRHTPRRQGGAGARTGVLSSAFCLCALARTYSSSQAHFLFPKIEATARPPHGVAGRIQSSGTGLTFFLLLAPCTLSTQRCPPPSPPGWVLGAAQGSQWHSQEAPPQAYAPEAPFASNSCFS